MHDCIVVLFIYYSPTILILNLKNICNFLNSFSLLDLKNSIYWILNQEFEFISFNIWAILKALA